MSGDGAYVDAGGVNSYYESHGEGGRMWEGPAARAGWGWGGDLVRSSVPKAYVGTHEGVAEAILVAAP